MPRRPPPPQEIRPLAEMLVHPDPGTQRQGQALLGVVPELAGPHLERELGRALWRRVSALQRADRIGRLANTLDADRCALFASRWAWAWRFCASHGLSWEGVRLATCAPATQRSRWARWAWVVMKGGVLQPELSVNPVYRELVLPLPADHPLREQRALLRDLGRLYAEEIAIYLPLREEGREEE